MHRLLRMLIIPTIAFGWPVLNFSYRLLVTAGLSPIENLAIDSSPFPPGWQAEAPDTDFPPLAPCSTGRPEVEYLDRGTITSGSQEAGPFYDSSDIAQWTPPRRGLSTTPQ